MAILMGTERQASELHLFNKDQLILIAVEIKILKQQFIEIKHSEIIIKKYLSKIWLQSHIKKALNKIISIADKN